MTFVLCDYVPEHLLIAVFGVIPGSLTRVGDCPKDCPKVDRNPFRIDPAFLELSVSWKCRGRRVAMSDPDPAHGTRDDLCRPYFAILPMLFLMRIVVVIRHQRHELNPGVVKLETGFAPKYVPVRPNEIPLAGFWSLCPCPLAILGANDVIVVHSADNLPPLWKFPVFAV